MNENATDIRSLHSNTEWEMKQEISRARIIKWISGEQHKQVNNPYVRNHKCPIIHFPVELKGVRP